MALTPSKEIVLLKLNENAEREHAEAVETATRKGRVAPPKPVPLTERDIEFPKWMHRNWKSSDKGIGHHEAKESVLVKSAEELKALGEGWSDEPPRPQPKK